MCSYKELADAGIEPLIYGKTQSQMTTTEWRRRIKRYCLHNHSSSQEWAHILPDVDRSLLAAVTDDDDFRRVLWNVISVLVCVCMKGGVASSV